jgi:hypothetical protein
MHDVISRVEFTAAYLESESLTACVRPEGAQRRPKNRRDLALGEQLDWRAGRWSEAALLDCFLRGLCAAVACR